MAWKDKISVSSQREKYKPVPTNDLSPNTWKFDMVHYPRPRGWQIENWRIKTRFRNDEMLDIQGTVEGSSVNQDLATVETFNRSKDCGR
tara:strand:- start:837 stop:1103 length:267 start_codon:yes stop_codon:yes gene_type:complete